ncbi:DUF6602 domain-containing protein [Serratia fonticola]
MNRLNVFLKAINATFEATKTSSSAAKGAGRANFVNSFLRQVVPAGWRISTSGEVTDSYGEITGELDIILENGFFPSLPVVGIESSRIFFAEGVAAVIEVKSNLKGQWGEALATGNKLNRIKRKISTGTMSSSARGPVILMVPGKSSNENIGSIQDMGVEKFKVVTKVPYFVVGYSGWDKLETLSGKLDESQGVVDGILQLDNGFFVSNSAFDNVKAKDASGLLAFLHVLHEASSYVKNPTASLISYGGEF